MRRHARSAAAAMLAVLLLAGCGDGSPVAGDAPGSTPPARAGETAVVEHTAVGTLNSIDAAAGTVNVSHEPVASIGWPAMTMNFALADAAAAASLAPGARIEFQFVMDGGIARVTRLAPAQ